MDGLANTKGEPHTPTDTSAESWWTNVLLIFIFVSLLTSTACWYAPSYMYSTPRPRDPPTTAAKAAPTGDPAEKSERPLLAIDQQRVERAA